MNCRLEDEDLQLLRGTLHMRSLNLAGNNIADFRCAGKLCKDIPNITALNLGTHCGHLAHNPINDGALERISSSFINLEELNIGKN